MQVIYIYAICFGVALALLAIIPSIAVIVFQLHRLYAEALRKRLQYPLLFTRRRGSTDVSRLDGILILVYLGLNIVFLVLGIHDLKQLSRRSSSLFILNTIPVFMGGRTNLIMDKILQASRQKCELAHRWIGRVVVLHGGLHGAICLYLRASTRRVGTPMLVLLIAILIHSLLLIRRRLYELFLKLHLLGAIGLLAMLWAHIELRRGLAAACLLTSSLLWALQTLWWLAYLIYQNSGSGRSVLSIVGFDEEYTERQHAVQVWISLKHPWKVLPGQYIYLTIPRYARQDFGLPQAHPYLILWDEDEDNAVGGCRKIVLLIASARGFSNNIRFGRQGGSTVLLDGPYGHSHDFTSYDTVFFMASGVGIAAHLLHMRRLLRAYYDRTCRIRRISLVWLVEEHGQEQWAIGILRQMLETDKSRVMTVVLYVPHEVARSRPSKDVEGVNLYREESALDIPWYIRKEQLCESGTMALSVCGRPPFERRIRAAACEISGIDLFTSAYLPDGDERDESWQNRCTAPPEEPGKRLQKAHLSVIPR